MRGGLKKLKEDSKRSNGKTEESGRALNFWEAMTQERHQRRHTHTASLSAADSQPCCALWFAVLIPDVSLLVVQR